MAEWQSVTLVVNTGSGNANVSSTLTTSSLTDGQQSIQNSIRNGGFWIQNTAAGLIHNQFIPATAILAVTIT